MLGRDGRFLPDGGKKQFFHFSIVKTGLAKIVFAGKNRFLPAKIGLCQNCHQNKLLLCYIFSMYFLQRVSIALAMQSAVLAMIDSV